jgi:sugar O-acyltransferase (sialic acid O-acetyltransferase NeuD family)
MRRLALLGASGHGKVVADAAMTSGWDAVEFFDDAWPGHRRNGPWFVIGDTRALVSRLSEFQGVVVAIGDCSVRWSRHQELLSVGAPLVTVVHPTATVSRYAELGVGCVVMAGAVVNVDACVGQAGIINTGATVDHDCQLADAVHICPGTHLSGNVSVGSCTMVGVGAAIAQGIRIGSHVVIGAGAVVIRSVGDSCVVAGNPGRVLRQVPNK